MCCTQMEHVFGNQGFDNQEYLKDFERRWSGEEKDYFYPVREKYLEFIDLWVWDLWIILKNSPSIR